MFFLQNDYFETLFTTIEASVICWDSWAVAKFAVVNFINALPTYFLYKRCFLSLRLAWHQKFVRNTRAKNVDKIDTWSPKPNLDNQI